MGNENGIGWGASREVNWTVTVGSLKDSSHTEAREALDALRQRHPEYLPQVWRELQAGNGARAAGVELPIRGDKAFLAKVGNPPPMLIEGILPDRSLFLLSGKPKAGKSFLALDMAYAVRQGLDVFGKYKVNHPGPVVYLAMEDGEYEIANRLLARGRGREAEDSAGISICAERFVLSDPERMDILRAQLEEIKPSLLIVDTAAEALGIRDWLNRGEITDKVGSLRDLARQVCAVLLVSHNRKSEGDAGDEIAGSNAFTGAVDGWISAYKAEALANGNRRLFLRTEGRGGVRGELAVEMDTKTLHFTALSAEEAAQGKENAAKDQVAEQVKQAIEGYGGRATTKQISDFWEWSQPTTSRRIQTLVASGFLTETGERFASGQGGPTSAFYRLA